MTLPEPLDPEATEPYVGEHSYGAGCTYSPRRGNPPCGAAETTHVISFSASWGIVGLPACDRHVANARAAGNLLDQHPFSRGCATGTCWPFGSAP